MEDKKVVEKVVGEVSKIVSEMAGIQLGARQFSMVENRLKSRMVRLGMDSFDEYISFLRAHQETESQALLSLLTTHHTYFFREFSHFEFLLNKCLKGMIERAEKRPDKKIRVWSAACSRGQEVYSLAMFFDFHLKAMAPHIDFEVWGTDVDPESVKIAQNGVYKTEELNQSPAMYVAEKWIRGKGEVKDFSKIRDGIKKKCHFQSANLLNPDSFLTGKSFDLIFCRNVFIYFDANQIKQITQKMMNHLDASGQLILGVSESLNGLGLAADLIGPSVYSHRASKSSSVATKAVPVETSKPRIIELLCVDDSSTIHALLKKIMVEDQGFRIKAVAKNGQEALDILKTQKFDAITLDLHMPVVDGIGFLKARGGDKTPVVILSSVNRDDVSIAKEAIALGAADYVEKPSMENLTKAGNEIRSKIKMAMSVSGAHNALKKTAEGPAPTKTPDPAPSVRVSSSADKTRVLIVDDSETVRNLLGKILSEDPQFEVVGEAEKPSEVEALIVKCRPDVMTLDIHMPEMDGVALLKKIHPKYKIPTVMISALSYEDGPYVLDALESGAIDYIQKPQLKDLKVLAPQIRERLKSAAKAKVVQQKRSVSPTRVSGEMDEDQLILIGSSTGGTEALRVVLQSLPAKIPPILIVQHIPPVFSQAFANRMNELFPFEVKEAKDNDKVLPNQVLIAPGGLQMGLRKSGSQMTVHVMDAAPVNRHKPSVDYLFKTAVDLKLKNSVGVILTGMGADGARELKSLRDLGVRTIAQDEKTSVVFGMPREAIERGAAEFILPIDKIGEKLIQLCDPKQKSRRAA